MRLDLTAAFETVDKTILLDRLWTGWVSGELLCSGFDPTCQRDLSLPGQGTPFNCLPPFIVESLKFLSWDIYCLCYTSSLSKRFLLNMVRSTISMQTIITFICQRLKTATAPWPTYLTACDIKAWLTNNLLKRNQSKTAVMVCRSAISDLGPYKDFVHSKVTSLGAPMDSEFKLEKQLNAIFIF